MLLVWVGRLQNGDSPGEFASTDREEGNYELSIMRVEQPERVRHRDRHPSTRLDHAPCLRISDGCGLFGLWLYGVFNS